MTEELKNCPFCGSQAYLAYYRYDFTKTYIDDINPSIEQPIYIVECPKCLSQSGSYKEPHEAIRAWNRRPNHE